MKATVLTLLALPVLLAGCSGHAKDGAASQAPSSEPACSAVSVTTSSQLLVISRGPRVGDYIVRGLRACPVVETALPSRVSDLLGKNVSDVSCRGEVCAYVEGGGNYDRVMIRTGSTTAPALKAAVATYTPQVESDTGAVAFVALDAQDKFSLYVSRKGVASRVLASAGEILSPRWTADGGLLFLEQEGKTVRLRQVNPDLKPQSTVALSKNTYRTLLPLPDGHVLLQSYAAAKQPVDVIDRTGRVTGVLAGADRLLDVSGQCALAIDVAKHVREYCQITSPGTDLGAVPGADAYVGTLL